MNHTQFNSNLDFPASEMSLVVIIRAVTGFILLMARYARPRSHIPHQGGHWRSQVTGAHRSLGHQTQDASHVIITTAKSPSTVFSIHQEVLWRTSTYICGLTNDHPCDVPRSYLLSLSAGDYRLLLSSLTGSRSRLPGSG